MNDMKSVIVPKSDQINADDLLSGPLTITITDVKVKTGQEQPVSIFFNGSDKAYRPCKSMARVLVAAWGPDASKYTGRSLTLYCDPKVKWGGMEVGGIRISHMSDIPEPLTMALTVTRANKKPFTVRPIALASTKAATDNATADYITADEALALEARCDENGINVASLKKAAGVERLSLIKKADHERAKQWIDAAIARRKQNTEQPA